MDYCPKGRHQVQTIDINANLMYLDGKDSSPTQKLREEVGKMNKHSEHFYAQSELSFLGLIDWAKEKGLYSKINELEKPWTDKGTICNFELIIEIPFDNKEMLIALFELVDNLGFKITSDFSSHFKEETDGEKMEGSETEKRDIA